MTLAERKSKLENEPNVVVRRCDSFRRMLGLKEKKEITRPRTSKNVRLSLNEGTEKRISLCGTI